MRPALVILQAAAIQLVLCLAGSCAEAQDRAVSSPAATQDWPQWRGPDRDGRAHGFIPPRSWPPTLVRKWTTAVGRGDATPALVEDRLLVFARQQDEEVLLGLDARDGKEIWRHAYPAVAVSGPAASYPGPRSSPAAGGGRVVMLGVGGVVTCLDIVTGRLVWRNQEFTNALPRFFTASSPLLVDGLCLVHVGGKDQGTLLALRLADGSAHWSWRGEGPAYASPVVMTAGGVKQIVLQTESHLRGLSLTEGKPLWEIPTPPRSGYWNSVTPVIDGATVIYSGQGRGTHAVRILGGEGGFSAEAVWSNDKVGAVYSTAVLRGGLLYGLSDRGLFFCLRAGTGETAWTATHRVSYFGAVIDAGPVLLALPEKSGLIAFKPGDQGYEELARIPVSESPIYAHPVAAGRRIFIRDAETVALWLLE